MCNNLQKLLVVKYAITLMKLDASSTQYYDAQFYTAMMSFLCFIGDL